MNFGAGILQKKNLWHRQCVYRLVCQYRLVLRKIGIYSPVEHDLATSTSYKGSFIKHVYKRMGVADPKSPLFVNVHKVEKCGGPWPSSIYSWSIGHILEHELFC